MGKHSAQTVTYTLTYTNHFPWLITWRRGKFTCIECLSLLSPIRISTMQAMRRIFTWYEHSPITKKEEQTGHRSVHVLHTCGRNKSRNNAPNPFAWQSRGRQPDAFPPDSGTTWKTTFVLHLTESPNQYRSQSLVLDAFLVDCPSWLGSIGAVLQNSWRGTRHRPTLPDSHCRFGGFFFFKEKCMCEGSACVIWVE